MNRFGGTIGLFTVALLWGSAMVEAGLGAETCAAAAKKDTSGYFQSISESLYAIDGSLPTNVDGDCLPTETTNKVGAWFNLNVDGLLGLEIDSRVYASSLSTTVPHEVAVMRGSCGSLTCLASGSARPDERDRMLIEVPFNLTTNDDYYVFISLENETEVETLRVGTSPNGAKADCEFYRSQQILFDSFNAENIAGTCSPCESSTVDTGSLSSVEWSTACEDDCMQCYNVDDPLHTEQGPFCFKGMRYWSSRTALDGPSQQPPEIRFCYTFSGGHIICDGGPKGGVCPLSLNGETCSSCLTLMDLPIQEASELATQEPLGRVAPCDFPDKDYGNFFADCTNVAGGAEVDKCLNTGFAGSLLSDYAIYTDIKLANAPASVGQCSATAVTPADLGFTQAPSPAPSPMPIATLVMGEKTEPFNLTQRERRIFELSVSDVTAIFLCRVESDGNNGDVDLSVAVDVLPTDETQECASKNADSEEECWVVVSGASLSVYAEVYADTATRDIQIECFIDEDESDARDVSEEVGDDRSFDLRQNQYELFMVAAPEGTEFVACTVDSDEGEVFLWMRVGQMPIPREGYVGDDSCQDTCESGVECCFVPVSGGDVDVFVLLYGLEEVDDGDIECVVEFQAGSRPTDRDGLELDDGEEFSLSLNQQRDFYVEIPQGTLMVRCSVESDDGSVFLAFRVGQPPLLAADSANDVFDCGSSTGTSGSARCTEVWSSTIGGVSEDTRIYLAVTPDGGTQVEDATIECTATVPVDDEEAFDVDLPFQRGNIRLNEGGRSRGLLFRFDIPEGVVNVDCFATSDFGDIDFYMRVDDVPNLVGNEFDCAANFFATSEEFCSISANRFDEGDAVFVFVHNGGDTAVQGGVLECFGSDAEDLLVTTSRSGPMGNPDVP